MRLIISKNSVFIECSFPKLCKVYKYSKGGNILLDIREKIILTPMLASFINNKSEYILVESN